MAEAILRHLAGHRLQVLSAGSQPREEVDAGALATLKRHDVPCDGLFSKSWDVYARSTIHLVITVCDQAAGEACPWFPALRAKIHLGMSDPSKVSGSSGEIEAAYQAAFTLLEGRMRGLLAINFEEMEQKELQNQIFALTHAHREESHFQI